MNLWLSIFISTIGLSYFIYGKKMTDFRFMIGGLLVMIYPYFTKSAALTVIIGLVLLAAPFIAGRLR